MARRKKSKQILDIPPHNPTGREILIKGFLGLIVGTAIAFLIFIMLILVSGVIQTALSSGD